MVTVPGSPVQAFTSEKVSVTLWNVSVKVIAPSAKALDTGNKSTPATIRNASARRSVITCEVLMVNLQVQIEFNSRRIVLIVVIKRCGNEPYRSTFIRTSFHLSLDSACTRGDPRLRQARAR